MKLSDDLRAAFEEFRQDPRHQFVLRVREARAEQLRALLSEPANIDLATFNREVWALEESTFLGDEQLRVMDGLVPEGRLEELDAALDAGELELHGNYMWRSGSGIYGAMLQREPEEGSRFDHVLSVLREADEPLRLADLAERAVARGLDAGGQLPANVVRYELDRHPEYFEEVGEGTYRLIDEDESRTRNVRRALTLLNQHEGELAEKAREIMEVPGFGPNTSTGLVMAFHPEEFAIYNRRSREAVEKLGLEGGNLDAFQESVAKLRQVLGARSFLELDWFLYLVGEGDIVIGADQIRPTGIWWVNQGQSYAEERDGGYVWAGIESPTGRTFAHRTNVSLLKPGDRILHYSYSRGELQAVSQVVGVVERRPNPEEEENDGRLGYYVRVDYRDLDEPIALDEIPKGWRIEERGPFNRKGAVNQGYLYPLSRHFVEQLADRFLQLSELQEIIELLQDRSVWLFQAHPKEYELADRLRDRRPGDEEPWRVEKYGDEIDPGDYVYVWKAGDDGGLYGMGEIAGSVETRKLPEWGSEDAPEGDAHPAVPVRYTRILETPILRERLRQDPTLSKLHVIRYPKGTTFKVNDEEHRALQQLLGFGPDYVEPPFDQIRDRIQRAGLKLSERLLRRYHLSLKTRGFVMLSGISGTGKTWLTELYARAVGARYRLVPVAPNWTSNEDLLGYWNPFTESYQHTEFSRFLIEAGEEWTAAEEAGRSPRPFHLALDEMNLARVEYYFAGFLSAMEVRAREGTAEIELGPEESVVLPPNLFFVGTVNVDETTHSFADKVYDRAQLLELEAPGPTLRSHLGEAKYRDLLMQVWEAVHEVAPFAFRVLDEIEEYVTRAEDLGVGWQEALDEQLVQKVLPKFKGSDPRLADALDEVVTISKDDLPMTHAKASAMSMLLAEHGFTSYF